MLSQVLLQGPPAVASPRVDTIPPFWMPQDYPGATPAIVGFRQLAMFGSPSRVVANPCTPLEWLGVDALRKRERALTDSTRRAPADFAAWFELACVETFLDWPLGGPIAHGEYMLAPATERSVSAITSLMQAAALRPSDGTALVLLSRSALRLAPGRLLSGRGVSIPAYASGLASGPGLQNARPSLAAVAAVLYRAVRLGGASAEVVRGCTSLMIDVGDLAAAHDCSSRALATGSDSTWHALRLAWLAYLRGDPVAGAGWFNRAVAAAHEVPARVELGWHFEHEHFVVNNYQVPRAGTPARTSVLDDDGRRVLDEKSRWLALPDSELMPALRHVGSMRSSLSTGELKDHFARIRYDGTAFRDCVRGVDSLIECAAASVARQRDVVDLAARRYQLWDPVTGDPMTLFVYSVSQEDLAVSDVAGRRVFELDSRLTETSPGERAWQDTTIALQVPELADRNAPVAGGVLARTARSFSSWTFTMRQPHSALRGSAYQEEQPPISAGPVALSDLVIGNANKQGVRWRLGEEEHIAAAPSAAADRRIPLQLYYQLRSTVARTDLKTTIAVYREGEKVPAIQAGTAARAGRMVNEMEQSLDISRLKNGRYWIELRVADQRGTIDTRSVMVEVR